MSSETLHENSDKIGPKVVDQHRAIVSLMEELEAVDWYNQRAAATDDAELRAILEHNRDEEKEHAAMVLEWLRRSDTMLDQHLRTYLFTDKAVTEVEAEAEAGGGDATDSGSGDGSLGIGSLKETR
ncbi:MAG TPA: ferritin-like domain-containing protein [Reyranella sp.]|jgi:ferritin-like protein|nr:ferritin-like domain-containing protein [Reyranella sp.]